MSRAPSNRRPRLLASCAAAATLLLVLVACSGSSGHHPTQPQTSASMPLPPLASRPNIVFVLTDDLSTNLVPYMPHVRALEAAGTSFANFYVVDSLCCPSRSTIFTGQYPHTNGIFTNTGVDGGYAAYDRYGDPAKSYALGLQAAGYRTGFMGKYLNGYMPPDPPAPGWDVWDAAGNGYPEFDYRLRENDKLQAYGGAPQDYLTDVLAGKAAGFIRESRAAGKPFALEVATFAPHTPIVPAPRDRGSFPNVTVPRTPTFDHAPTHPSGWMVREPLTKHDIGMLDRTFRRRVEAVQAVDRMIGTIEQTLAATGELRNTYIVFSSDNGYHLGDYQLLAGKQTAFDTDIRVPLAVTGPGVPAGRTVRAMTSSVDLAPTFLNIAGAQPTDVVDGVSLLNLMHGATAPRDWQRAVLIEHHGPVLDPNDPDVQSVRSGIPPSYEAMRSDRFLYVEYGYGGREYYDLAKDPYELDNIAGSLSDARLTELHRELHQLEVCSGAAECRRAAQLPAPQ